jgi:predicted phosphodiesterase
MRRREFIAGAAALGAFASVPAFAADGKKPVKFLFMADHHVESDFMERGHEVYTMWRPGNHAALEKTYEFIGKDPYCRDIDFALFGGDQLNTGYMNHPEELAAERAIYYRTLDSLGLYKRTKGKDVSDLDFRSPESFFCRNNMPKGYVQKPIPFKKLDSRVIAIQGNHDTGVEDFYRECSFKSGDTRFITFFASYIALPAPPGKFRSTAKISDESVAFVEREMAAAAADPAIRHIVLACHWTIVLDNPNFKWPIFDACKENGFSDNRKRILEIAAKYGCDLYINGHEHNPNYPVGKAGTMNVINCGTVTAQSGKASFAIVEIRDDKAVFTVYSRANAVEGPDGAVSFTSQPERLFVREVPLVPIR